MDTIKLWGRDGDAVRQAIELGELVHLDTAREELTDEFLLFAIESGLLAKWAEAFPDPRCDPEICMEVILASHLVLQRTFDMISFCHTFITESTEGRMRETIATAPAMALTPQAIDNLVEE